MTFLIVALASFLLATFTCRMGTGSTGYRYSAPIHKLPEPYVYMGFLAVAVLLGSYAYQGLGLVALLICSAIFGYALWGPFELSFKDGRTLARGTRAYDPTRWKQALRTPFMPLLTVAIWVAGLCLVYGLLAMIFSYFPLPFTIKFDQLISVLKWLFAAPVNLWCCYALTSYLATWAGVLFVATGRQDWIRAKTLAWKQARLARRTQQLEEQRRIQEDLERHRQGLDRRD